MNTQNWTITIGQPATDSSNPNKVNVAVTYAYDDGTSQYSFTDSYSGILSNDNLMTLIQENLIAHQDTVSSLLNIPNIPVGVLDLSQLYPSSIPQPALAIKSVALNQESIKTP